ncbi:MAG TPA: chemotaxis protein CheA, partial [Bryobacteraceae bacterium]
MNRPDELRRQVEELALRFVIGEPDHGGAPPDPEWAASVGRIRECALREHAVAVADAAAGLLDTLGRTPGELASAELLEGVARLQQALESAPEAPKSPVLAPAQDPELLADFTLEAREHLAAVETQVLTLERDPCNSEALHSVFRGFHTIKGLAGFLELWDIQKIAHEVETVLDRARNSEWTITPAAIDVVLESTDFLRRWLAHLEAGSETEASALDEGLLARVRSLTAAPAKAPAPPIDLAALAQAVEKPPAPLEIPEAPPSDRAAPESAPAAPAAQRSQGAVKVDTAKLDYLVDMAGELVIAESLVRHDPGLSAVKNPGLQRHMAQLTRITAELQKTAMAMRLVTIGPLFRRMARLVRDLSKQFGKQVEMETRGDEIELDRTIVEELADPLMHMVRNAMDHGLESPAERETAGKSPAGRLFLAAHHRAGQVVIEIADDGRGLNRGRIRARAVERELISPAAELSDNEIYNLIFEPGFTTAAKVTNVSGRGVGMDVVRKHIEKLRGRIEIRSAPGQGASFFLKLPLTLAIIDGLVVGVGRERYIVPLFAVREMFRPSAETIWTVEQRAEMALVRGSLLPVLRLYRRFAVTPRSEDPLQSVLVIAESEGQRFGLLVDELIGKQEVVIKSLGETFQGISGIAGGAILGDGR